MQKTPVLCDQIKAHEVMLDELRRMQTNWSFTRALCVNAFKEVLENAVWKDKSSTTRPRTAVGHR